MIYDFLHLSHQRIPRYRMLLEELLKKTPESHFDYEDLSASLKQVSEIASLNNEAIRRREGKDQIMQVMMMLDTKTRINLLDKPGRMLRRQATMNRQTRRTKKPFMFWLFNDRLLYGEETTTVVASHKMYILNRDIDLLESQVFITPYVQRRTLSHESDLCQYIFMCSYAMAIFLDHV